MSTKDKKTKNGSVMYQDCYTKEVRNNCFIYFLFNSHSKITREISRKNDTSHKKLVYSRFFSSKILKKFILRIID